MSSSASLIGVAGTASGVGKTLVSLGLMQYFDKQGMMVQPFKVGPDYIDPLYHESVTGRSGINLDYFFSTESELRRRMGSTMHDADVGIVEGVMGLYDGISDRPFQGSTAEVFRILDVPYILVVDGSSRSHSIAAEVKGFTDFDERLNCLGVVINRVASDRHETMLRESIDDIPVLATVREVPDAELPSRHLGLDTSRIVEDEFDPLNQFGGTFERSMDHLGEKIQNKNRSVEVSYRPEKEDSSLFSEGDEGSFVKIGVFHDEAFHFYYRRNMRALEEQGADIVTVSPLHDDTLPRGLDGLYIGGGYPEEYAGSLSSNTSFVESLRKRLDEGITVYAECGGLIYLGRELVTAEGDSIQLVDWFPLRFRMTDSIQALSYVEGEVERNCVIESYGFEWIGHEFHYTKVDVLEEAKYLLNLDRGTGIQDGADGVVRENAIGCYSHSYWNRSAQFPRYFVETCRTGEEEETLV